MLAGLDLVADDGEVFVGREVHGGIHGRVVDAEGKLALERHGLGRLDREHHQELVILVIDGDAVGSVDLHGFAVVGNRRVIVVLRQRLEHRLADFLQFIRVERGVRVLVEVENDACRKQLVEPPDIPQLADPALFVGDDLQASFREYMRVGEGESGREERRKAGHDDALCFHGNGNPFGRGRANRPRMYRK